MPSQQPQPRLITISSTGLTHSSFALIPFVLKPLYALLSVPHKDKVGAERVIAHCAGWKWEVDSDEEPGDDILGERWLERDGLPAAGSFKNVLVIRPALLTDGECKAEKGGKKNAYRVKEGDFSAYTVSRKDVGHFVADAVLNRWSEFENKLVTIGY